MVFLLLLFFHLLDVFLTFANITSIGLHLHSDTKLLLRNGIFTRIYLLTYSQPIISNKRTMKQPSRHDDNVKSDRDYLSIDFNSVNN